MRNQETPRPYLELHRACLGGVKGVEEVMSIRAGVCKWEGKAGELGGQFPQRAETALENRRVGPERREGGWIETHLLSPWSLG